VFVVSFAVAVVYVVVVNYLVKRILLMKPLLELLLLFLAAPLLKSSFACVLLPKLLDLVDTGLRLRFLGISSGSTISTTISSVIFYIIFTPIVQQSWQNACKFLFE
jgi:hypothetical protein